MGKIMKIFLVIIIFIVFIISNILFKPKIVFYGEGNSTDNIRQCGYIAENEKYIVFSKSMDQAGLYYIDKFTMKSKKINSINGNQIYYLNMVDETIYYNVGGDIYSYNIKENKGNVLFKNSTYNTIVFDNYIYTIKSDDNCNSKLYKMNFRGKSKEVIIENLNDFCIYQNVIYFSNIKDNYNLYCCDLDGLNIKKISDIAAEQVSIHNDKVYFVDVYKRNLYKMNKDGENLQRICDYKITDINVTDERILFCSNNKLYISDLNLTKIEVIAEGVISDINTVGDILIYRKSVTDKLSFEGTYIMDINKKVELKFTLDNLYSILGVSID